MKKFIFGLLFVIVTTSSSVESAHAQYVVWDPTNYVENTINVVQSTITAIAAPVTAIQQTLETINNTILIPMQTALTMVQILQNSKMITVLIQGSLGNEGLLITNPELYLKNQGINITQSGIDALGNQNSIFGNSVIGSVVESARFNASSLTLRLNTINQSSVPSIQQAKICYDDTALGAAARSDTTLTGADYTARKAELNHKLCDCDPRADTVEGKACAQKLMAFNNKNPSLDSFYAITQGDNAYVKAELAKQAIAADAEAKKAQAAKDLAQGGGIKSKSTCLETASNGGCIQSAIDQLGSVLNNSYTDALGSGLKTALSTLGPGTGSLIGTVFNTINLVNGITTSIGAISGNSSGGSGGTANTINYPTTYNRTPTTTSIPTNTTQTSTVGFAQDLVNNPQTKAVLAGTPMQQLNYHKEGLTNLGTTDSAYISAIDAYNSQLDTLGACYSALSTEFPIDAPAGSSYASEIASALSFVSSGKSANNATRAALAAELGKIGTTNALITNTINTIQSSNSTTEITSTFANYQTQVKDQQLPNLTSGVSREGERLTFNSNVLVATMQPPQEGRYTTLTARCGSLRGELSQLKAAREAPPVSIDYGAGG